MEVSDELALEFSPESISARRASLSVQYAIGSLYALFFLAVAGLVAYAATEAFLVIVGAAVVFWAIPWFRRRGRAA